MIWGCLGTPRGTLGGPELDFNRFWMDLGTLLGSTLASFLRLFRDLGLRSDRMGSRVGFLVNLE